MRNRERNKCQKKLTKLIREMNKDIEKDNLWLGRFYMMQRRTMWYEFPSTIDNKDASGYLMAQIRCYDKITGYYHDYIIEYAPYLYIQYGRIWKVMNDFITKDLGVWEIFPTPRIGRSKDCRNISYMENDTRADNFYISYVDENAVP